MLHTGFRSAHRKAFLRNAGRGAVRWRWGPDRGRTQSGFTAKVNLNSKFLLCGNHHAFVCSFCSLNFLLSKKSCPFFINLPTLHIFPFFSERFSQKPSSLQFQVMLTKVLALRKQTARNSCWVSGIFFSYLMHNRLFASDRSCLPLLGSPPVNGWISTWLNIERCVLTSTLIKGQQTVGQEPKTTKLTEKMLRKPKYFQPLAPFPLTFSIFVGEGGDRDQNCELSHWKRSLPIFAMNPHPPAHKNRKPQRNTWVPKKNIGANRGTCVYGRWHSLSMSHATINSRVLWTRILPRTLWNIPFSVLTVFCRKSPKLKLDFSDPRGPCFSLEF